MSESNKPESELVLAQRSMELVEIESQIATAKRYPRDIKAFKDKLMAMVNLDQETAESCYYALPRSGKAIDGPSVRLAEIALSCYQNVVAESDVLSEDDRFIHAMGQCRDLENNVMVRVKIRRRITNRQGKKFNDDMIAVTANAACAVAFRNAVFKVIPGAYIKPAFDMAKKTAVGNAKSLVQRRGEVIARLMQFGVTQPRILAVINCKSVDEVTFDHIAALIGLGTAIHNGETTVEEAFPILDFKEKAAETKEKISNETGSKIIEADVLSDDKSGVPGDECKNKEEEKKPNWRDEA